MIDATTGNVHLPNGFVITPSLTLDGFRQSRFGREAEPNHPAGEKWNCWFDFVVRVPDAKPMRVGLSFYEQMLVSASLAIRSSYGADTSTEDWLAAEVRVKAFHEELLRQDLGVPNAVETDTGEDTPGLDQSVYYWLPWGKVHSTFDYGGGDSYISIEYANRREQARTDKQ